MTNNISCAQSQSIHEAAKVPSLTASSPSG